MNTDADNAEATESAAEQIESEEVIDTSTEQQEEQSQEQEQSEGTEPDFDSMSDEDFEAAMESEMHSQKASEASDNDNSGSEQEEKEQSDSSESEQNADPEKKEEKTEFEIPEDVDRVFQPFQSGGRQMQANNPDEVIQLMQMGANYTQKMQALAPHLKRVKTLEKAGIDDAQLNYLIDLHNKNPQAINKLIADSEIDPMDLGEDDQDYKPTNHAVSDQEMKVEDAIDSIRQSEHFNRTLQTVSKDWDSESREAFVQKPHMLKTLNSHMESGIFDLVDNEIARRRSFGQLEGLSDVAAYEQIGDELNAAGAFNHLGVSRPADQTKKEKPAKQVVQPQSRQRSTDKNLNARRRAASPTRATSKSTTSQKPSFDPMQLSDEEFEAQFSQLVG